MAYIDFAVLGIYRFCSRRMMKNSIKKKNICSAKEKENEKKKEDKSLENGEGIYWLCSRRRMNQFYWLFISSLEHAKTAEGKHQIYLSFDIQLVRLYVSEQRGNSWDCVRWCIVGNTFCCTTSTPLLKKHGQTQIQRCIIGNTVCRTLPDSLPVVPHNGESAALREQYFRYYLLPHLHITLNVNLNIELHIHATYYHTSTST